MESSYSNLDNVANSLSDADIVWQDHSYASLSHMQSPGSNTQNTVGLQTAKQESSSNLIHSEASSDQQIPEELKILPFKSRKSKAPSSIIIERCVKPELPQGQRNHFKDLNELETKKLNSDLLPSQKADANTDKVERAKHILHTSYFSTSSGYEELDIVSCNDDCNRSPENEAFSFDKEKLRTSLCELERSVRFIRKSDPGVMWESKVDKSSWNNEQMTFFKKVLSLLATDTLKRLVYQIDNDFASIHTLNIIRYSSQSFRDILAGFCFWDLDLIDWMHCILCNHLSNQLLVVYLQLLQNLKLDIPSLIQGIIERNKFKISTLTSDFWMCLNRRLVDPAVNNALSQSHEDNRKKNNIESTQVIVIPNLAAMDRTTHQKHSLKRFRSYVSQMTSLGKVTAVNVQTGSDLTSTPENYLSRTLSSVHTKLDEMKHTKQVKSVVLVGFGLGSLVCAMVAAEASYRISAFVCIGLPLRSINGQHTSVEDYMAHVTCPVLFVIGEMSKLCLLDDLEDLRLNMRCKLSSVVVVDGCNDNLLIGQKKAFEQKVTQSMLDKYICSEINAFVTKTLKKELSVVVSRTPTTTETAALQTACDKSQASNKSNASRMTSKMSYEASEKLQRVAERHRKQQQAQQDDESNAAANMLENILESGGNTSAAVPFASNVNSNCSSRENSPSRLANLKKRRLPDEDTDIETSEEDSSDSGDSFASSNYADMRRIGETMITSKLNMQYFSHNGKFKSNKTKGPRQKQIQSKKSILSLPCKGSVLPKNKKNPFKSLSYSQDIASGSF
ncbi:uncharacterized protein LOC134839492 [Symsagittifera roscoffensis]|uniref:uncharacterized protein LOC134839492 n=1 Tax=Symsagittifera roscoffensis TaxID=84072 RepID=UPI00307B54A6